MTVFKVTASAERSFRETLRWATRDSHAALDASFERVTDPAQTALYDAFVRMNHACHGEIEPILRASPLAALAPIGSPSRTDALARDMDRLGLAPLPVLPFPNRAPDLAQAAGMAYVLEGSRLGATFIARRLEAAAKAGHGDRSREFLNDSAAPKEFTALMDILSRMNWTDRDLEEAAAAACATFRYFDAAARTAGVRP